MLGKRAEVRRIRRRRGDYDRWKGLRTGFAVMAALAGLVGIGIAACWLLGGYSTIPVAIAIFGGLLFLLGLPGTCRVLWEIPFHRRLTRSGQAADAEVIENLEQMVWDSPTVSYYHDIKYRYTTAAGVAVERTWKHADEALWELKPGDKLGVLYDPRRPRHHVVTTTGYYEPAEEDDAGLLLRPASVYTDSGRLLRPASGATMNSANLVRPVEAEQGAAGPAAGQQMEGQAEQDEEQDSERRAHGEDA